MKKIFSCIAAVWMLVSCDPVTDPVKATGIEIRPSSVTLEVGKTEELTFAVLPEQAVQKVLWESSNEKIVTVKEGKVTAIAAGKAEVKAVVAENKSLTAVCTVTVTEPVPESLNLEQDVPDEAFRAVLTQFDTNKDGIVSRAEADMVTELDLEWDWDSAQISDLQGIGFFTELQVLNASYQNLNAVDLSKNTKLKRINLEFNFIKSLDLSNQIHLIESETTGSATYYGLQVGYQKADSSDYSGNGSIAVILPETCRTLWETVWSKNKQNNYPVNQGVTVTFQ